MRQLASSNTIQMPPVSFRAAETFSDSRVTELARSQSAVFLVGEKGVGKATLARKVHQASRPAHRFVCVNCRDRSEEDLNVELFGCPKDPVTGRGIERPGRLQFARQGTLFLDGAEAMEPGHWQRLQEALTDEPMAIRLIASVRAAPGPSALIRGWIARLDAITLEVLPLRMRKEEIPLYCNLFLQDLSTRYGFRSELMPEKLARRFQECGWESGNLHDLKKAVRRYLLARLTLVVHRPV